MHFSFDTENGAMRIGRQVLKDGTVYDVGEELKNRVITYAPLGIRWFDDVRCIVAKPDEDVYELFYRKMRDAEPCDTAVMHVWNLDWEWKPLTQWFLKHCRENGLDPGSTEYVATVNGWYRLTLHCKDMTLIFVDDNNHYHTSVKKAMKSLMEHKEWKRVMEANGLEGKESDLVSKLHEIWYSFGENSEEWRTYIHYAKVDAFCQALLMENLFILGRFCGPGCFDGEERRCVESTNTALSASGAGFRDAKSRLVYGCAYKDIPKVMAGRIESYASRKNKTFDEACSLHMGRWLDMKWTDHFGLLTLEEQMTVERNLRAGFVYGVPGVHKGTFWHYDYKSSYPYEYAFCKLPCASYKDKDGVKRCLHRTDKVEEMEKWLKEYDDDGHQLYLKVKLVFELKDKALPLITAKECVDEQGFRLKNYGGKNAKKMKSGRTGSIVMTLEEWRLVNRLYEISEETVLEEVWVSKAEWGFFKDAVQVYFDGKESTTGAEKAMYKLDLNGATHGRAMMKVVTSKDVVLEGLVLRTAERKTLEKDIQTNPLIGMTAMGHARVRLLNHCMDLIDAGYKVYMCDTDSMVTDCPPEKADEIWNRKGWKNWVMHKNERKGMKNTLGRLEIEQKNGEESFDEFRCWGLKRYAEFSNGGLRKTAFAGMHDEDQKEMLGGEYSEELHWHSTHKEWAGECYTIRRYCVDVKTESIWYGVEA